MKKYLIVLFLFGFIAQAQELKKEIVKPQDEISLQIDKSIPFLDAVPAQSIVKKPVEAPDWKLNSSYSKYERTLIGKSQYGLQTNASIARRMVLYGDGKLSVTFTTSPDISPFNTRGSGYNHFNGSSWFGVIENRIETFRSGWPNLTTYNNGTIDVEYIVSHYAEAAGGSGGYSLNVNNGIGSTTWSETSKDKGTGPIWARTAITGDYLHIIGNYSDTNVKKNGVTRPFVYSRYNLKTQQWVDDKITLPNYDNKLFPYGVADNYSIEAQGSNVAIVFSLRIGNTVMWKSKDNGNTWEMIYVEKFQLPKPKFLGDTNFFYYGDGSVHVILDKNNVAHVFQGAQLGFTYDPSVTDGTFRYYPTSNAMLYFNDIGQKDSVMVYDTFHKDTTVYRLWVDNAVVPFIHYMKQQSYWYQFNTLDSTVTQIPKKSMTLKTYNNKNKPFEATTKTIWPTYYFVTKWDTLSGMALDSTLIPPDSVIFLDSFVVEIVDKIVSRYDHFTVYPNKGTIPTAKVLDRNESGTINIEQPTWDPEATMGARYGNTALVTMPQAAIDDAGNIYLVYSAPVEEAISPINGENYRDVYVVYSKDGGKTWSNAQNISNNPVMENVFGHVSKKCDNYLHVYYQEDEEPGTEVQNGDHPTINYIFYHKIPLVDILNDELGSGAGLSIKENSENNVVLNGVYPNPVNYESTISFNLKNSSDVSIAIIDILGKKVAEHHFSNLQSGTHELSINASGLKSGTYILNLTTNTETTTTKLIVR